MNYRLTEKTIAQLRNKEPENSDNFIALDNALWILQTLHDSGAGLLEVIQFVNQEEKNNG